jgi:hypothetical protein
VRRIADGSGERVWFDADEIEQTTAAALRSAGLWPRPGADAVDIEQLVELHLNAAVDYAADLPDSVLGYTEFTTPPRVVVSRTLTDLALAHNASLGLRGRWRATLAHEAAHILLHAGLGLVGASTPKLTATALQAATLGARPSRDWREVQANMGMAALLMPRAPFLEAARGHLEREAVFLPVQSDGLVAKRLVSVLAEQFQTSQEATRLRLLTFGWVAAVVGLR